ncbi:MAG: hypothetical protein D3924_03140, partial [Candidatus Electrothrix sp. AR4]|nr:hypothetical protein [Candidatus Electrothrix sp. AR4]
MNKNLIIGVLFILMLVASVLGQKEAGENKARAKENETLQKQLLAETGAKSDRNALQAEVAEQETAQRQIASKLKKTSSELNAIRKENNTLKVKIASQDTDLKNLKTEKEKATGMQQEELVTLQSQLEALQTQLKEQQTVIDNNKSELASNTHVTQQIAQQGRQHLKELEETRIKLKNAEGMIQ